MREMEDQHAQAADLKVEASEHHVRLPEYP